MTTRDYTEDWERFHAENPHVFQLFARLAFELIKAGETKLGARMIWERMRWHYKVETTEAAPRLNDHYPPFYARHFMRLHPQHAGIFETRTRDREQRDDTAALFEHEDGQLSLCPEETEHQFHD